MRVRVKTEQSEQRAVSVLCVFFSFYMEKDHIQHTDPNRIQQQQHQQQKERKKTKRKRKIER